MAWHGQVMFDWHGHRACNRHGVPADSTLSSVMERGCGSNTALALLYIQAGTVILTLTVTVHAGRQVLRCSPQGTQSA
jgi:hypothetical protein